MDGVLPVNKPKGITSTRVVEKVRRKLWVKVGHTGTLDPMATGVLLLTVGGATRFSWLFTGLEKEYKVKALLGLITDTYDLEGKVLEEREVNVGCDEIEKVLEEFRGELEQVPPPFSAKKVSGRRAYKLARKGIKPELRPVKVTVYEIKLLECSPPEFELYLKVSSGTYVRSLVHDIGGKLSTGAVVKELVRLSVGPFRIEDAVELDDLLKARDPWSFLIPVDKALSFLPSVSLDFFNGRKVLSGNPVLLRGNVPRGYVRIYVDSTFVGVGTVDSNVLKPERLLIPESLQS